MSDTTITPEERAKLRSTIGQKGVLAFYPYTQLIEKMLNSLEITEARAEHDKARAETMRKRLMEQVDYTKTILSRVEQAEAEVARLLAELTTAYADGNNRVDELSKDNARLNKMVDWFAEQCADGVNECPYISYYQDLIIPECPAWCICTDTAEDGFDCSEDAKECWLKEAARKAVAAGEGKA